MEWDKPLLGHLGLPLTPLQQGPDRPSSAGETYARSRGRFTPGTGTNQTQGRCLDHTPTYSDNISATHRRRRRQHQRLHRQGELSPVAVFWLELDLTCVEQTRSYFSWSLTCVWQEVEFLHRGLRHRNHRDRRVREEVKVFAGQARRTRVRAR